MVFVYKFKQYMIENLYIYYKYNVKNVVLFATFKDQYLLLFNILALNKSNILMRLILLEFRWSPDFQMLLKMVI